MINIKGSQEIIADNKVFFVGNVMIDSLTHFLKQMDTSKILQNLNVDQKQFVLVTLHRPSNVDEKENQDNRGGEQTQRTRAVGEAVLEVVRDDDCLAGRETTDHESGSPSRDP